MSYFIAAISNSGGAPEQAYRKMQAAGACPEKPFAGTFRFCFAIVALSVFFFPGRSARALSIDKFSYLDDGVLWYRKSMCLLFRV
jgi:hypothetical protein